MKKRKTTARLLSALVVLLLLFSLSACPAKEPIGKYDPCPENKYKIALVCLERGKLYHWYRQDANGFWSHKMGRSRVTNLDDSSNFIIDPEYTDRLYEFGGSLYTVFVGYFEVSPLNLLYDPTPNQESTE